MDTNQNDLIQKLASSHTKKSFWKKREVLLSLWFGLNLVYFSFLVLFFSKLDPNSSTVFLGLSLLSSLAGWFFFTRLLNSDDSEKNIQFFGISSVIGIVVAAYLYDDFLVHNILHERGLSMTGGDLSCFSHTVLAAGLPLLIGTLLIKSFFVGKRIWAFGFLAFHVSAMSILWTEMTCPDREFWHLIVGHESSFIGAFVLVIFLAYLTKRRASLVS